MNRGTFTIRRQAARDLSQRAAWLKREAGDDVAERFLSAALESFAEVAGSPGLGPPVEKRRETFPDLRKWRIRGFANLSIFYVERPGGVAIVRVLHAAQDRETKLESI